MHMLRKISVFRPHLKGNVWENGPSHVRFGGNNNQLDNYVKAFEMGAKWSDSFMPLLYEEVWKEMGLMMKK